VGDRAERGENGRARHVPEGGQRQKTAHGREGEETAVGMRRTQRKGKEERAREGKCVRGEGGQEEEAKVRKMEQQSARLRKRALAGDERQEESTGRCKRGGARKKGESAGWD